MGGTVRSCVAPTLIPRTPTDAERAAMQAALAEARLALAHDDVPVGAVILVDGKVVAQAHNRREVDQNPCGHAELLAINAAARALGRWRLDDATLVVTLEPCVMCAGAIVSSRMKRLVFGAPDGKAGACGSLYQVLSDPRLHHEVELVALVEADACGALLTDFFTAKRGER
jgi:tRNA(adenine34) deaminase